MFLYKLPRVPSCVQVDIDIFQHSAKFIGFFAIALATRCLVRFPFSMVIITCPRCVTSLTFSMARSPVLKSFYFLPRSSSLNTCVLVFLNDIFIPNLLHILIMVSSCSASLTVLQNSTTSSTYKIHLIISTPRNLPFQHCSLFMHMYRMLYSKSMPHPSGKVLSILWAVIFST